MFPELFEVLQVHDANLPWKFVETILANASIAFPDPHISLGRMLIVSLYETPLKFCKAVAGHVGCLVVGRKKVHVELEAMFPHG